MKRELPPIAKRAAQVLTCIEESVMRFGRAHRYSVGADLRREAMQVSRGVHRAWNERSRQRVAVTRPYAVES